MNIQYVLLTCDNYYATRCQWQKDTWLTQTTHHVFLGCKERPEWNMVGWNTSDDYESCPIKVMNFVRHYELDPSIDWIVFADDDTFMFPRRLETLLKTLDPSQGLYIGSPWNDGWEFMSGGAGFVVSRPLFEKLKEYTNSTPDNELHTSRYSDVTFGSWVLKCNGTYIRNTDFHGEYKLEYGQNCISCHYLKENDFRDMSEFLNNDHIRKCVN